MNIKSTFITTILLLLVILSVSGCAQQTQAFTPVNFTTEQEIQYTLSLLQAGDTESAIMRILDQPDSRYIIPLHDQLLVDDSPLIKSTLMSLTLQEETQWQSLISQNVIPLPQNYTAYKLNRIRNISSHYAQIISEESKVSSNLKPERIYQNKNKTLHGELNYPSVNATLIASPDVKNTEIIGITVNGESKAYALNLIQKHDIINDNIGGKHITLAYCSLCNIPVAYDTTQQDGSFFSFKPTTLVYNENHIMYDSQTNTLWSFITGKPLLGFLVDNVNELPVIGFQKTTWKNWSNNHPNSTLIV